MSNLPLQSTPAPPVPSSPSSGGEDHPALVRLLDRPIDEETLRLNSAHAARPLERRRTENTALAVFRLGDELIALPAAVLRHVDPPAPVQPIPHRRSAALRGLAAVRGELLPCIDLRVVLGLPPAAITEASEARRERRMVVLRGGGAGDRASSDGWALEVDAVLGVERFERASLRAAPATVRHALDACTAGLVDAGTLGESQSATHASGGSPDHPAEHRTISVLDADLLLVRFKAALA